MSNSLTLWAGRTYSLTHLNGVDENEEHMLNILQHYFGDSKEWSFDNPNTISNIQYIMQQIKLYTELPFFPTCSTFSCEIHNILTESLLSWISIPFIQINTTYVADTFHAIACSTRCHYARRMFHHYGLIGFLMNHHLHSLPVQYAALKLIEGVHGVMPHINIMSTTVMVSILQSMDVHVEDPTLQMMACHVVGHSILSHSAITTQTNVIEHNAIPRILQAMSHHPYHPLVQINACRAIRNICMSSESEVLMAQHGSLQYIFQALFIHRGENDVTQVALEALRNNVCVEENREYLHQDRIFGLRFLCFLLEIYCHSNPKIIIKLCRVIQDLHHHTGLCRRIVEGDQESFYDFPHFPEVVDPYIAPHLSPELIYDLTFNNLVSNQITPIIPCIYALSVNYPLFTLNYPRIYDVDFPNHHIMIPPYHETKIVLPIRCGVSKIQPTLLNMGLILGLLAETHQNEDNEIHAEIWFIFRELCIHPDNCVDFVVPERFMEWTHRNRLLKRFECAMDLLILPSSVSSQNLRRALIEFLVQLSIYFPWSAKSYDFYRASGIATLHISTPPLQRADISELIAMYDTNRVWNRLLARPVMYVGEAYSVPIKYIEQFVKSKEELNILSKLFALSGVKLISDPSTMLFHDINGLLWNLHPYYAHGFADRYIVGDMKPTHPWVDIMQIHDTIQTQLNREILAFVAHFFQQIPHDVCRIIAQFIRL